MAVALPLEVYETFEKGFGKEDAKRVVRSFETVIQDEVEHTWRRTKDELLDAIRKEFITREVFEERINAVRTELLGKMEKDKIEIEGNIKRIDIKMNFLIILTILALTLMNPVVADIIKGLIK
ncbi:MAG: hypothetical protein AB1595_00830 [bacterium]